MHQLIRSQSSEPQTVFLPCSKLPGRRPFTQGLGLEKVGVKLDQRKRVEVRVAYKSNLYTVGCI